MKNLSVRDRQGDRRGETERIITEMLRVAAQQLPLKRTLQQCLEILLRTPWLRTEDKGGIFLTGADGGTLELVVEHDLGAELLSLCAKVPFGHCLCGRAAQEKAIQYAHCVDERHDIRFAGMTAHGHYNVPIMNQNEVLGVIVLYLPHGFEQSPAETVFLENAANVLSMIVQIKKHESHLEDVVATRTRELEDEVERGLQRAAALHRSESRLTQLLDLAPEAIISIDEDRTVCLYNKSAEQLFGYSQDEMLGAKVDILLPVRFRKAHPAHIRAFAASDTTMQSMSDRGNVIGLKKDGTEFPAQASISKLRAGDGDLYTILIKDISEQRAAADALLQAKQSAESANRTKSEFLANTSHELKTPLNAIIGFANIIAEGEKFGLAVDAYGEYGRDILGSGERLLELINDVLDLSRIETGDVAPNDEEISVATVVHTTVEMMRGRFPNAPVDLRAEVAEDLPKLRGDKRMVRQIVVNLLANAIKFSPNGGTVSVRAGLDRGAILLSVEDRGIGMAADDFEKALQPFHQLDAALSRRYEGMGLGLSLVKLYADCHGAVLGFRGAPGRGSNVSVRFPPDRTLAG